MDIDLVRMQLALAGERIPESATASYLVAVGPTIPIRKDNFSSETLIAAYPCVLRGIVLNHLHDGFMDLRDANATGGGSTGVMRIGYPGVDAQATPRHQTLFVNCFDATFFNGLTADSDSAVSDATFLVRML